MHYDESEAMPGLLTEEDLKEMMLRLAHEIRNPLATIKSGVQLMQRRTGPEDSNAEYLSSLLLQVDRIGETLSDVQRFVRLGAGWPLAVDVGTVVRDVIDLSHPEASLARVTIVVDGGPELLVRIDRGNFQLSLRELVSNAIRHSPADGSVRISWGHGREGMRDVRVDDQGTGVPAGVADRIMRPFFSTSTQGTGLGLNIVEKVCRLSGGHLEWRNLPEVGCRFTMVLRGA